MTATVVKQSLVTKSFRKSEIRNKLPLSPLKRARCPLTRPYGNAATREARRFRILGMIRGGARYDEIAAAEGISRERVRQIVTRSLERDDFDKDEHRRVQAARLEPALKLALDAIAEGRIEAIDRLIRVLAAQDKYLTAPPSLYDGEDVRERLLAKLDRRPGPCRRKSKPR